MKLGKLIAPVSILLFLAGTFAGMYYVRKSILERHMIAAMEIGDGETMRRLARSWPSPVNACSKEGETPLRIAVLDNDIVLTKLLLDKGADVNSFGTTTLHFWQSPMNVQDVVQYVQKATPLHLAVAKGHTAIAGLLVEGGADVNLPTRSAPIPEGEEFDLNIDYTPLQLAGDGELAGLLRAHGAKE